MSFEFLKTDSQFLKIDLQTLIHIFLETMARNQFF
jgi:hypothetical protein